MNAQGETVELAAPPRQRPGASTVGFGSLWVAHPDRGRVARLDLEEGNIADTIVVSERVGNVQVRAQWGILLSRLWVE